MKELFNENKKDMIIIILMFALSVYLISTGMKDLSVDNNQKSQVKKLKLIKANQHD